MTKEDLNRQFGDPERPHPSTPPELLFAAHLIREHCNSQTTVEDCTQCIFFNRVFGCSIYQSPGNWDLSNAESRTADWINKQYDLSASIYTDTDK